MNNIRLNDEQEVLERRIEQLVFEMTGENIVRHETRYDVVFKMIIKALEAGKAAQDWMHSEIAKKAHG